MIYLPFPSNLESIIEKDYVCIMKVRLKIYYCENGDYSKQCFEAEIEHRLLNIDGSKKEICYDFRPEVFGFSNGRFNIMICDTTDQAITDEDSVKYFAKINTIERLKLKSQFNSLWIQKEENIWKVITPIVSGIIGIVVGWILYKINHPC